MLNAHAPVCSAQVLSDRLSTLPPLLSQLEHRPPPADSDPGPSAGGGAGASAAGGSLGLGVAPGSGRPALLAGDQTGDRTGNATASDQEAEKGVLLGKGEYRRPVKPVNPVNTTRPNLMRL